jgi:hypothetical protein
LRLLFRRVWIADAIAAIVFAITFFPVFRGPPYWPLLVSFHALVRAVIALWLMRRFGLLAASAAWFTFYLDHTVFLPGTWYAGRSLATLLIPLAIAAWALWVILSAQRRPLTESSA